jgi:uncharacterized lipoprotein YajG
MKKTLYLLAIALIMGACSYKNEPIVLKPYEVSNNTAISKEKKSVFIESINDQRADTKSIGYAQEHGEKIITFFSNENFEKKYKDALLYALNISEFNTNVSKADASAVIEVNIKEIELVQIDKSFDENLKGKIIIELVLKSGNTITKHNFTQKAGEWLAPSRHSKDLEPFLSMLFSDSIDAIVAKLAE